ncbi:Crp/Fnr family transcriptional regulator [Marinobacterium aestuariivivens]|uniref:Crp/Fnr family transcriptional regulator n=1 Tax=Marinobacterium aestuariivivens TaxID=1698799 RepID=A0ABW1ZYX2_9GAMM
MATHDKEQRRETLFQVRRLMPETTLIVLEPEFSNTDDYDLVLKLHDGRLQQDEATAERNRLDSTADFESKRRIIAGADVFSHLRPAQIRLLAYASHWVRVEAGDYLFRAGDFPDGAYILAEGVAQMRFAGSAPEAPSVTDVGPGRLIGDLSVILDRPRSMNLLAIRPVLALRLERRELLQIIDNDVMVATSLLRTVSGHLYEAAESIRVERYENDG